MKTTALNICTTIAIQAADASEFRISRDIARDEKRLGLGSFRRRLEILGLARSFDPFDPRKDDLSVDTSKIPEHARRYVNRWFRIGLMDFRFGHVVSGVLAVIFLLLAAVWMYPSEHLPEGVVIRVAWVSRVYGDVT